MCSSAYSLGAFVSQGVWSRNDFQSASMCHINPTNQNWSHSLKSTFSVGNFSKTPSAISETACAIACARGRALGLDTPLVRVTEGDAADEVLAGELRALGFASGMVIPLSSPTRVQGVLTVLSLDQMGCLCSTMFRVSPNHLLWVLEGLVDGQVHNQVEVPESQIHWGRVALDRMLQIH